MSYIVGHPSATGNRVLGGDKYELRRSVNTWTYSYSKRVQHRKISVCQCRLAYRDGRS